MELDTLTLPLVPDFVSHLESRMLRDYAGAVDDWSRCVAGLTAWEDEHLLDEPAPEMLARHRTAIEGLMRFGRFLSIATANAEFPDKALSAIVAATQNALRDKLIMWHNEMPRDQADRLLETIFNEPRP